MARDIFNSDSEKSSSSNKLRISSITIYRSGVTLAIHLIVLEVIFVIIGLLIRVPLGFFIDPIGADTLYSVNTIIGICLVLVKLFLMIVIIFQWLDSYYEIRPGMIIYKSGFLFRQEREFDLVHVSKINLTQGFFARFFNFGTINLYVPTTDEWFALSNIPNPHRNLQLIRKSLTNKRVEITMTDELVED